MEQQYISRRPWFQLPFLQGTTRAPAPAGRAETFRAETFPHMNALYTDAFWLTGNQEEAADLVVEAYLRAFQKYDQFRRRRVMGRPASAEALSWLYRSLHAAFCDRVLAQAQRVETRTGGRR